ncbi:MAG: VOC family protein [Nannocystaceae bacterium]|nr:VOC family protein [Nannocystaceae bacterium]
MRGTRWSGLGLLWILTSVACGTAEAPPLARLAKACLHGEMSCARPIFNVGELKTAQGYYTDVLGFSLDWEDGEPADFASVSRGDATLFLCQGCQGTPGAWMMVFVSDVDALHREWVAKGARIRMPPTDMRWQLREMHVSDPWGNVIRFGSPLDD